MSVKYHISEYWCNDGGRKDYGAMPTFAEAVAEVQRLLDSGQRGGCRCRPGWSVTPCGYLRSDHKECEPYNADKFKCEEEEIGD